MIEVNDYDAVLYTFYNGASSMQNLCIWPKSLMLGENDMFNLGCTVSWRYGKENVRVKNGLSKVPLLLYIIRTKCCFAHLCKAIAIHCINEISRHLLQLQNLTIMLDMAFKSQPLAKN